MKGERYSDMNPMAMFGLLSNALDQNKGNDGDTGASFPRSDAEDFSRGARFIPYEVTMARRSGKKVQFVTNCSSLCCWYWQLPDGTRIYHFERGTYERILKENGGICPNCSNNHIERMTVKP